MAADSDEAKRQKIEAMYQKARRSFPGVAEITFEELRQLLAEESIVLVDVRTPAERAVSMIPSAVTSQHFEENEHDYKGATVVTYCTIGGRSGQYAKALAERGWKVFNFKGAILAWTHGGGDLESADGPTRKVHVHGRKFDLVADDYEGVW
jgi:sodium/bile acid cotransporter 7